MLGGAFITVPSAFGTRTNCACAPSRPTEPKSWLFWQREEKLDGASPVGSVVTGAARERFQARPKRYTPAFFWGVSLVP